MDYSKWESLSKEVETDEIAERDQIRESNRQGYLKEQAERSAKLPPSATPHRSCCGYADPEQLKHLTEQPKKPQLSPEELYAKQLAAVHATREHGNQLFKEGNFDQAFQVYERGALILAGMIGSEDLSGLECTLNLNMALIKLKQLDYLKCVECVNMALAIQPNNPKAHYRLGLAHLGMGDYIQATTCFNKVLSLDPKCRDAKQQLQVIQAQKEKQGRKEAEFAKRMASKMSSLALTPIADEATKIAASDVPRDPNSEHKTEDNQQASLPMRLASGGLSEPGSASSSSSEAVRVLLDSLDLAKYSDLLIGEGFDSMRALKTLTLEDLLAMGMKRGHARVLLQKLQGVT